MFEKISFYPDGAAAVVHSAHSHQFFIKTELRFCNKCPIPYCAVDKKMAIRSFPGFGILRIFGFDGGFTRSETALIAWRQLI